MIRASAFLAALVATCTPLAAAEPLPQVKTNSERFARCAAAREPEKVLQALSENWEPELLSDRLTRSTNEHCMKGMPLAMNVPDLRQVFALEMLNRKGWLRSPADFSGVPPLKHSVMAYGEFGTPQSEAYRLRYRAMAKTGECIVRQDSQRARQFLAAAKQAAAQAWISPQLASCKQASATDLSATEITGTIALAYLRLHLAAQSGKTPQ